MKTIVLKNEFLDTKNVYELQNLITIEESDLSNTDSSSVLDITQVNFLSYYNTFMTGGDFYEKTAIFQTEPYLQIFLMAKYTCYYIYIKTDEFKFLVDKEHNLISCYVGKSYVGTDSRCY